MELYKTLKSTFFFQLYNNYHVYRFAEAESIPTESACTVPIVESAHIPPDYDSSLGNLFSFYVNFFRGSVEGLPL